jgi:allantoicase
MNVRELVDLASERLGAGVLYANDEFFAEKENLIKPSKPVWKEHEYTDRGKWMDGWETRRKRTSGHDFAIIRLGARGVIRGVVVDTSYFRGNYPESFSLDGASASPNALVEGLLGASWREVIPRTALQGDSENEFAVDVPHALTHLRFNIFPDGGVARLRVFGDVVPDWHQMGGLSTEVDLAAVENGGEVLSCSDMFFGPKHNLIMPGRALNMSDGWETRRRRGPGYDWVIVKLATEGIVHRIEIDTNHFKGNYPDTASIEGCNDFGRDAWREALPRTRLQAHTRHFFVDDLKDRGPFTHVRLNVFPDGGVSRLRVWSLATDTGRRGAVVRYINTALDAQTALAMCCGSSRWAESVAAKRPFADWDELILAADNTWNTLDPQDWLEAFRAHPRIGERATSRWSAQEQSGTQTASTETMNALSAGNRDYEEKFGHIFLISASGKSADDILGNLRQRLGNDPETELRAAADEQRKITALRLEKLVM